MAISYFSYFSASYYKRKAGLIKKMIMQSYFCVMTTLMKRDNNAHKKVVKGKGKNLKAIFLQGLPMFLYDCNCRVGNSIDKSHRPTFYWQALFVSLQILFRHSPMPNQLYKERTSIVDYWLLREFHFNLAHWREICASPTKIKRGFRTS